METRSEDMALDIDVPKDEKPCISGPVMKIKTGFTIDSGDEVQNKIEMSEKNVKMDADLQNENFISSDIPKNNSDDLGIVSKIEVKEEPWCQDGSSLEVKCKSEPSSVWELEILSEIRNESNEDTAAGLSRLYKETSSTCDSGKCLLITADMNKKGIQKGEGEKSELVVSSVHDVYENDVQKECCTVQSIPYCSSKLLYEDYQSKKPDIHSKKHMNTFPKMKSCLQQNSKTDFLSNESRMHCTKRNTFSLKSKRQYICAVCKRSFAHSTSLKRHILIHDGKRLYKCEICEKSFTQKGNLNYHILIHEGKKPYKCEICEKSFTQIGHFKRHVLIHEGKRPYRCEICEKCFTRKGHLQRHILIHEGQKRYKCEICEKTFADIGYLKSHLLIHEYNTPYKCKICEKSFTHTGSLNRHMLIHEGKRPYKCDICEKHFSRKEYLKSHILIHGKPYKCEICEKKALLSWEA